jgi:urease accessory protein
MDIGQTCVVQQRARGVLHVGVRLSGGATRLADLRQQGCLRACFPRAGDSALQAVALNTSGGVTDGDHLRSGFAVEAGASLTVATQAAERIYRARAGAVPARVETCVTIGQGASAHYLPQETILFDASALERKLHVEMDADSVYLGVETLVFGRAASGEVVRNIFLRDTVTLRRAGRLVLHDAVRLQGEAPRLLRGRATAGGAGAVATLLYAAPDAAARLDALRDALAGLALASGASFRDGLVVARIVAQDGWQARRAVLAGLGALLDGRTLPRVWNM